MAVLIDTSILIGFERQRLTRPALDSLATSRAGEECYLSVIVVSELLHGVHRATDEGVRSRRAARVEAVVSQLPVLPIDMAIARTHARLWADLAARGDLIGAHDLWLAASAIAHGMTLLTLNVRELERVPGLAVETLPVDDA